MRRLVIMLVGSLVWATGGVLLAQNLEWNKLARFFRYQDSLRVDMDPLCLERLEAWEAPDVMELPDHVKSPLLQPYFLQTHPGQSDPEDFLASPFFQDELYAYAYKPLPEGGHAMILLGQGNASPYLLLLTYKAGGEFMSALTIYADHQRQGMSDQCRSEWMSEDILRVRVETSWEDPALRQSRHDTVLTDYKLMNNGKLQKLPQLSDHSPNR